ncbi:hypothetical protein HA466_0289840 [Hirschfeldia incana]|nr:hypothetical protein HA466_0289840 [Hirschfeldia incana]
MSMTTFVPLTKLRPFKDSWRVQVKCLHSWKQTTTYGGDTFEMVLADQWGNKIHATSKRSLMQRIQRVLPIDSWGVIEQMSVTAAGGQYRTTTYKYKMVIAEDAVLSKSDLVDDRIFLSVANYDEIEKADAKKQAFLIGEVQITNAFDASRLFLNAMIPEVTNLTQRLSNDDQALALVQKPSAKKDKGKRILYNWNDAEIKTITELAEATQVEICKIICTIESIDTDWPWFYFGCNRHQKRVNKIPKVDYGRMTKKDKPLFRYEQCRSNISNVAPKFKLHLVVKDDSATCNVMLLGSVGKSIVGVEAEELWDGSYEEKFVGDKVLTIESESQTNSDMVTTSSTMSSGSAMLLDQNSSDECPTPITKRKEDDSDLQDLTSSSKKQCTKIIKQEKTKTD